MSEPADIAEALAMIATGETPDKPLYYARGLDVFKSPIRKSYRNGSHSIEMGFRVCTVTDELGPEGATTLAEMLVIAEAQSTEAAA